jgi:hypothetical protein
MSSEGKNSFPEIGGVILRFSLNEIQTSKTFTTFNPLLHHCAHYVFWPTKYQEKSAC